MRGIDTDRIEWIAKHLKSIEVSVDRTYMRIVWLDNEGQLSSLDVVKEGDVMEYSIIFRKAVDMAREVS